MANKQLYKSDILTVEYDPDYKILFIILSIDFGQVDNEYFIKEMSKILPLFEQVEVVGILFDLKDMAFPFTEEINDWLISKFGYTVWLHHVKYFSYVYPEDYAAKLGFDLFYSEMMSREAKLLEQSGKTELMDSQKRQFFNNREEALNWLKTQIEADSK